MKSSLQWDLIRGDGSSGLAWRVVCSIGGSFRNRGDLTRTPPCRSYPAVVITFVSLTVSSVAFFALLIGAVGVRWFLTCSLLPWQSARESLSDKLAQPFRSTASGRLRFGFIESAGHANLLDVDRWHVFLSTLSLWRQEIFSTCVSGWSFEPELQAHLLFLGNFRLLALIHSEFIPNSSDAVMFVARMMGNGVKQRFSR